MSHFANYLKERSNEDLLEFEEGFVSYKIFGQECYIKDIYVAPEHREKGLASSIADEVTKIAKEAGCKFLTGSVCPSAKNSHVSLLVLLGYGMRLLRAEHDMVYFIKEI